MSVSGRLANGSVTTPMRGSSARSVMRRQLCRHCVPQRPCTGVNRFTGSVDRAQVAHEAMDHSLPTAELDVNACLLQPPRVTLALIDEGVVLGGEHECGRDATEVRGGDRCGVWVYRVALASQVHVPEKSH